MQKWKVKKWEESIFFFRKTTLEYCLFDQIRIDGGKKFYLILGIQEHLSN